jgi:hypothetical protein
LQIATPDAATMRDHVRPEQRLREIAYQLDSMIDWKKPWPMLWHVIAKGPVGVCASFRPSKSFPIAFDVAILIVSLKT